jgi:hypothetical protein
MKNIQRLLVFTVFLLHSFFYTHGQRHPGDRSGFKGHHEGIEDRDTNPLSKVGKHNKAKYNDLKYRLSEVFDGFCDHKDLINRMRSKQKFSVNTCDHAGWLETRDNYNKAFHNTIATEYLQEDFTVKNLTRLLDISQRRMRIGHELPILPSSNQLIIYIELGDGMTDDNLWEKGNNDVKNKSYYENILEKVPASITNAIVMKSLRANKKSRPEYVQKIKERSNDYVAKLIELLSKRMVVSESLATNVDKDFLFMIQSQYFTSDQSYFSKLVNKCVIAMGGHIIQGDSMFLKPIIPSKTLSGVNPRAVTSKPKAKQDSVTSKPKAKQAPSKDDFDSIFGLGDFGESIF